jgi:hypothetical protein
LKPSNGFFRPRRYPIGGASQIVASVLPTIERVFGGAVVVNADSDRILLDGLRARVRMTDGREFRAAGRRSDAGIRTMDRLLENSGV